jgi:hypothetical protein
MLQLRHADEQERRRAEVALGEQPEWRVHRDEIGELAERLDAAISARDGGAARAADPHERVVESELDVGTTRRATDDHDTMPVPRIV